MGKIGYIEAMVVDDDNHKSRLVRVRIPNWGVITIPYEQLLTETE